MTTESNPMAASTKMRILAGCCLVYQRQHPCNIWNGKQAGSPRSRSQQQSQQSALQNTFSTCKYPSKSAWCLAVALTEDASSVKTTDSPPGFRLGSDGVCVVVVVCLTGGDVMDSPTRIARPIGATPIPHGPGGDDRCDGRPYQRHESEIQKRIGQYSTRICMDFATTKQQIDFYR
eukprot:scaffold132130_cov60-Attheya_sp.AAC.3